jgi:dTDP-4-amino-4,6-dideoxygalactose transaminase
MDIGSSFLPSDIIAAFLFAQLENLDKIQSKRKAIWNYYYEKLKPLSDKNYFKLLELNDSQSNNGHLFALIMNSIDDRTALIEFMRKEDIMPVFHYLSLHKSQFYIDKHDGRALENCDMFADRLVRMPLYFDLNEFDVMQITDVISAFFNEK